MTLELRKDEVKLIHMLRKTEKYSTIKVEKRPTKEFPDGELQRVVVESSYLLGDIALRDSSMV